MRRFAILGVCLLAGLTLPQVALGSPALLAHSCGSNCGSLDATGKGTLNVNGNGAEWGSIASGTVKVQDKSHNGHQDWSLTGCDKRFKDESDKTITVCQANNTIYFSVSTVWWLSLSGSRGERECGCERRVLHQGLGGLPPERRQPEDVAVGRQVLHVLSAFQPGSDQRTR